MKVALVSCASMKLADRAPAADLYTSPLFRLARAWAEANADTWFILSAEHGLVDPATVIEPYDTTLNKMPKPERDAWAERTRQQLQAAVSPEDTLLVLAGKKYRSAVEGLENPLQEPLKGLGIGHRLSWLKSHTSI